MHPVRRATALAVGLLLAAGCSTSAPAQQEAWAGSVDRWLRNLQEAAAAGLPNLSPFLDPHVVVDFRAVQQGYGEGPQAALSIYRYSPEHVLRSPAYLSTAGLVAPSWWMVSPPLGGADLAMVMTFSRAGLAHERAAVSLLSGRAHQSALPTSTPPRDWEGLEVLAERYVAAWSGDLAAAADLYAPTATLQDGLLGLRREGLPAVRAQIGSGVRLSLDRLPRLGGPAVFGVPAGDTAGFAVAVLLLDGTDGGCAGHLAVVLTLDPTGKISAEERYHRLDDARRCSQLADRPAGWWDTVRVPDPVAFEQTGTVVADKAAVEVWNGTPQLEALLEWALGRYAAAGLEVPEPASVTFFGSNPSRCAGYAGLASGIRLTDLAFCFGTERACPDGTCPPWAAVPRNTVLHELAHTWLSQHLTDATRARYLDAVHLRWAEPTDPWTSRGIERAASTIAWGLDAQRPALGDFGSPSDQALTAEFRLLTGHDPP